MQNYTSQRDWRHFTIEKTRRCFLWDNLYFQMDIYRKPATPKYALTFQQLAGPLLTVTIFRCDGLILLETFTTLSAEELMPRLPPFLNVVRNVTGDPEYSMYNLSKKEDSHRKSKEFARPLVSSQNTRSVDCGTPSKM